LFHKWFTLKPLVGVRKLPGAGVTVSYSKESPRWSVSCDAEHCKVSINHDEFIADWGVNSPTWGTVDTRKQEYHFCPAHKGEYHSLFGVIAPGQIIREVKA
jgi:hypothetical protein